MTLNNDSGNTRSVVLAIPQEIDQGGPSIASTRTADEPLHFRPITSLSPTEFQALERLAFEHGQSPDSYLIVEPHRLCYLAPDHSAALSVTISGRNIHIAGGILAPVEIRRQIIARLADLARKTRQYVACYSIGEMDRPLFEEAGWQVTKFGENTSLNLETLSWSGKPYEWVRRQFNFCQRTGLACREVNRETMDEESWKTLTEVLFEIQRDDLKDRVYPSEMSFLVGKLLPENLGRRRLFIVEDQKTMRVEAFVIANPMRGGKGWAFEMYRKRQDAPRGTIPFLLKWIIDVLKAEGVEEASLCMLPWKGTHTFKGKRTSSLVRWGLVVAYHLGDPFYNTKGMAHFKTRFRPELSNCYACGTPKATILVCLNFFYMVGAFSFSTRNILRNAWFYLTRRKSAKD